MVDDKDNYVDGQPAAWELALALVGAFRSLVDQAHGLLAASGYAGVRPVHGFALQAIGDGTSVSEVGRRLGVSKQAAAKTVQLLADEGYVDSVRDPHDGRARLVVPTERGRALLVASAKAFDVVVHRWAQLVGAERVEGLHSTLIDLGAGAPHRLDLGVWAGNEVSAAVRSGTIAGGEDVP